MNTIVDQKLPTLEEVLEEKLQALKAERYEFACLEQSHLETGSSERKYWHHGYASALKDVLRILQGAGFVN